MKGGRNKRKEGTDESEGKKRSEGNEKEPKEVEGRNVMKGGSVTSKEKRRQGAGGGGGGGEGRRTFVNGFNTVRSMSI